MGLEATLARLNSLSGVDPAAIRALVGEPWAISDAGRHQLAALALQALQSKPLQPLQGTRQACVRDGVAVVPVCGPLTSKASFFSMLFGGSDYESIAQDLTVAMGNDDVRAVLLDVDSPGGLVAGAHDVSQLIRGFRGKGKSIYAFVGGTCASAAYWITSACDKIIVSPTALVGNIGAFSSLMDDSELMAKLGLKWYDIANDQSPNKLIDPAKPEDRARVKTWVTDQAAVFIGDVAAGRGRSSDEVEAKFGRGDLMVGATAQKAGLCDGIGDFESVLAGLASESSSAGSSTVSRAQAPARSPLVPRGSAPKAAAVPFEGGKVIQGKWDASAAEKRIRAWAGVDGDKPTAEAWAKYRKAFAWYDGKNAESFGAYKLPHHDVQGGKLVVHQRGVEAAAGVVSGARGGADIPAGDLPGVRAHLGKHYAEWGGTAPWDDKKAALAAVKVKTRASAGKGKAMADMDKLKEHAEALYAASKEDHEDGDAMCKALAPHMKAMHAEMGDNAPHLPAKDADGDDDGDEAKAFIRELGGVKAARGVFAAMQKTGDLVESLRKENAQAKADKEAAEVKAMLDEAMADGRLNGAADRADAEKFHAEHGTKALTAFVARLPKKAAPAREPSSAPSAGAPPAVQAAQAVATLTATELALAKRRGVKPEDFAAFKAQYMTALLAPVEKE